MDGTSRVYWVAARLDDGRAVVGMLVVTEPPREPAQVIDLHAPSRATLRGTRVVGEGCCDLCADVGISTPASAEGRLAGGMWADLCAAHAYRARSAGHLVLDAADLERSAA